MKKKYLVIVMLFIMCRLFSQVPTLTLLNSYTLTPNATDSIGAFARIYYHQLRNKFYVIYAARPANSPLPSGQLTNFAWREYNASMLPTGVKGTLPGFTGAGDFAMVQVDSTYFHLTALGSTTSGILKYKLTKLDDDFIVQATQTITLNAHDNNIDQLMNYANGRLIIGAMHDSTATPPVTPPAPSYNPNIHLYQYDLNLNPIAPDKILNPKTYSWGGSCIYESTTSNYYIVSAMTQNQFATATLTAHKYDNSFNYLSSTTLSNNGQWPQGVIKDGQYYYVAYHVNSHNRGNISLGIFNSSWANVATYTITNYTIVNTNGQTSYNANRPFLTKVGNKLYISYDVEKYIFPVNQKDWQAHVKVYQMSGATAIKENTSTDAFRLYPNPSNDKLYVEVEGEVIKEIAIYDMKGTLIKQVKWQSKENYHELDISDLSNTVYFCKLISDKQVYSRKFVKD